METRTQVTTFQEMFSRPAFFPVQSTHPEYKVVNRNEILRVLERAAHDSGFIADIADRGSRALADYHLTLEEKAALVSGDIRWVEEHVGELTDNQCTVLNCMLQREAW
jgi:hypothetical protein